MALIGSIGSVYIAYPHNLDDKKNHTISYSNDAGIALDEKKKEFIELKGKFPKKLILSKGELDLYQEQKIRIKTRANSTGKIDSYSIDKGNFNVNVQLKGFFLSQMIDDNGNTSVKNISYESTLRVFADETSDYLKFEISNYKPFEIIDENIDIEYIAIEKTPTGVKEHILKIDRLNLLIDGHEETLPEKRIGTLSIYDGKNTKNLVLFSENGVLKKKDEENGEFNIHNQASFYGNFPRNIVSSKNKNVNLGEEQKVILTKSDGTPIGNELSLVNSKFDSKYINFNGLGATSADVGGMYIFTDDDSSSVKIRFSGKRFFPHDLNLKYGPINCKFNLKYQAKIGNEWCSKSMGYL